MEPGSDLVERLDSVRPSTHRRLHYRQRLTSLIYLNLEDANGGIIRDLSERGAAIQAVSALGVDQIVHLHFDLLHPRVHVKAAGRVVWADSRGQAGVSFDNLESRLRRLINQWILTQLLSRAQQVWETGTEFSLSARQEDVGELHFSGSRRKAIRLELPACPSVTAVDAPTYHAAFPLRWLPFSISPFVLSRCVDGANLAAAALLFSALVMTGITPPPPWRIALPMLLIATSLFAITYWYLFAIWMGGTPGARVANRATSAARAKEDDRPRFR
jgi:PilZ domain